MEENKNILTEENNNVVPTNENKPNNAPVKSNKGLIACLIIIILLLAAALVYFVFLNKKEEPNKQTEEPKTEQKEETKKEEVVVTGDYELTIYRSISSKDLANVDKPTEYHEEAFKLKVNTKDAKVIDIDSLYVLYKDDGIYLYDVNNKKTYKVELDSNYEGYAIVLNTDENKILGISYIKANGDTGFFNYAKSKRMYDGKFKVTLPEKDYYVKELFRPLSDKYMTYNFYDENDGYLLNINEEKEELKYASNDETNRYFNVLYSKNGKNVYYVCGIDCDTIYAFYSDSLKQFFNKPIEYNEFDADLDKKIVLVKDTDGVKKFDFDGNLVKSYPEFTNVKSISKDHVLYVKDNKLTIGNTSDETEKVELTTWNDNWSISIFYYYTRAMLDEASEKNKKEGWYVTVEYPSKDSNGNYGMEYCYTSDKQIVEYPIKQEIGGRAKPVLYLYPTKETNVTVKFENPNLLTTTYPKYINSWNVRVKPNGDMKDADGKYYYALYWDEKRYNEVDFTSGFYVESKDAINFLEEKLTYIGLNDKERNEFIMYWLPIMENNKKNLVYFELTEERELGNKLIIEPKPDSLLRISIHIKRVNQKVNVKEQKLETFNRSGFTAVEWGGMTY